MERQAATNEARVMFITLGERVSSVLKLLQRVSSLARERLFLIMGPCTLPKTCGGERYILEFVESANPCPCG